MEYSREVEEVLRVHGLNGDPHACEDWMYRHTTKRAPVNLSDHAGPRWLVRLFDHAGLAGVGFAMRLDDARRAAVADMVLARGGA